MPKEIPIIFHNGSTYDYHFIIKQSPEEFEGQFECLGENTEKYITFSVPIKKEHDNGKTSTYKLTFIDSHRFMQSKLSDLVDNLSEIFNKECKSCMERKKVKSECGFIGFRNNRLNYKCKECGKRITYEFCWGDRSKFALLLRKGDYPYEYMDSWVISLVFITQLYFKVPKDVRLNTMHFFIMKILNKRELQQTSLNHSSDISTEDFIKIHKKNYC